MRGRSQFLRSDGGAGGMTPLEFILSETPLHSDDKHAGDNDAGFDTEITGEIVLKAMIDIGREADSGGLFEIMIGTVIATVFECIEEKFAGIAIYSFENPAIIPVFPVSPHTHCQTAVIEAVFHRSDENTVF
jgi:hypothetical protein